MSAAIVKGAYPVEIIMQFVVGYHSSRTQVARVIVGMSAAIAGTATASIAQLCGVQDMLKFDWKLDISQVTVV